jgi:hypothetical protein
MIISYHKNAEKARLSLGFMRVPAAFVTTQLPPRITRDISRQRSGVKSRIKKQKIVGNLKAPETRIISKKYYIYLLHIHAIYGTIRA